MAGTSAIPAAVEAARALAPHAAATAAQAERERRLDPDLLSALIDAGLFRLCVPHALGGLEVDVATLVASVRELARGDASAAWCVAVGATSGAFGAWLEEAAAEEIYGDPRQVLGGVFAPLGSATPEGESYRVNGRWAYVSGSPHCAWLMGGCVVLEDGRPRLLDGGRPDVQLCVLPAAEVEIVDTWSTMGLRATSSHDMIVRDALVPAARTASVITQQPLRGGALYAFPLFGLLALGIAGVALGIADGALADFAELAGAKRAAGSRRTLAQNGTVQAVMARAWAGLSAAEALVDATVARAWDAAVSGAPIDTNLRASLRLAASHAVEASAAAVDAVQRAAGGGGVYERSPLERRFRDMHVATQHMIVGPGTFELAGRALLGVELDESQL